MNCTKCPHKLACLVVLGKQGRRIERIYDKCYDLMKRVFGNKDAYWAYFYALNIIEGRWIEGEEIIKQDACWAYHYALNMINRRWVEGEEIIKQDACWAHHYAFNIIKGRWLEAEEVIKQNSQYAYCYASEIFKSRWPEEYWWEEYRKWLEI